MSIHTVLCVQTIPSIGATYQNVIHVNNDDGGLTPLQIAQELETNFMPRIQNFQSWFLGWQYFYIYRYAHPEVPVFIYPLSNSPGLAHVGYLYPTNCFKLKWYTSFGGRHGRGRFYIAGGRDDWATAGGITASAATNGGIHLAAIVARYKFIGGSGPIALGIVPKNGDESDFHGLESAQYWQYLGQQRRRQYGVGI